MRDIINRINQAPMLEIPRLFDEKPAPKPISEKTKRIADQFRFTTESSMEGFYKNPRYNNAKNDKKVEEPEQKTENWFG